MNFQLICVNFSHCNFFNAYIAVNCHYLLAILKCFMYFLICKCTCEAGYKVGHTVKVFVN